MADIWDYDEPDEESACSTGLKANQHRRSSDGTEATH
jgi:hypothetical protein